MLNCIVRGAPDGRILGGGEPFALPDLDVAQPRVAGVPRPWLRHANTRRRGGDAARRSASTGSTCTRCSPPSAPRAGVPRERRPRGWWRGRASALRHCLTPGSIPGLRRRCDPRPLPRACEADAVGILRTCSRSALDYAQQDGARFFDAERNATPVANAEHHYRAMYHGGDRVVESARPATCSTRSRPCSPSTPGREGRRIQLALGDARATEMGVRGQINVGQLLRALRTTRLADRLRNRPRHGGRRAMTGTAR